MTTAILTHHPTTLEAALDMIAELDQDPAWGGCSPAGLRYRLRRLHAGRWGVVVLDLDNLHSLNDTLGHAEVDRRMQTAFRVRHSDVLRGRWAFGDEVVLIVPAEDARDCAARLLHDLRAVGLSATFAVVEDAGGAFEAAVAAGQTRIEAAKRAGERGEVFTV